LVCSIFRGRGFTVPNQATAQALEQSIVARLAKFFPGATPVRIPIKLSRTNGMGDGNNNKSAREDKKEEHKEKKDDSGVFVQDTVIEFGTSREVLFAVDHPMEFADHVIVETKDGALHAEASVVAVQYRPEKTVVAVRFLKQVPNWIVKS
jgi:hypothetical protein